MARSNFANFATRTIKRVERQLLETEDSIRQFAGILCGGHLPLLVRAAVLGWIFVVGHIFWGFC